MFQEAGSITYLLILAQNHVIALNDDCDKAFMPLLQHVKNTPCAESQQFPSPNGAASGMCAKDICVCLKK